ncbi:MAG: amino acid adenylation domain-containing protein, partial [Burkholderiaceae bacterium]
LPFRHSQQLFAGRARYALALSLCEFGAAADPELALEASAACFEADEATLLARRLWHLAEQLANEPQRRLDELEILPPQERWAVVEGLHQQLARRDALPCFIESFEHQAALQPDAPALVWNEGQLSYGQLDAAATVLAQALARRFAPLDGPAPLAPRLIALALPRSPQQVTALLACAKCGAAFLPLDIEAPPARLAQLLADSGAALLLVGRATPPGLRELHPRVLDVDGRRKPLAAPLPLPGARPEQLAYVLYTSGSTGQPKGVQVPHLSLSRRLAWLAEAWAINAGDRAAQSTQLVFDPALIELLLALTQGASVALPPPGRQHPLRLAECVLRHGVTFCALVPTTLAGLLDGLQQQPGWRERLRLRVACCGGEVLPPELARRFLSLTGGQLYNLYGPTEATIFASAWCCADSLDLPARPGLPGLPSLPSLPSLPLGRPVDDTRLYVMDERQRPLPFGVTGEICIGGTALAAGYLRRPALDAERFLPDPLQPGGRLYRSGDRGWLDTRGVLHFAGRSDRQIKLRGYRIELGDVEAACLALPGVNQAWAAKIELGGGVRLHAWLAAPGLLEAGAVQAVQAVQAALRQRLPDYMVPASLSLLAELPRLVSGKIDVAALPPAPGGSADAAATAAASPLERELQLLWQQQLPGRPLPALQDNFFDLGGDSLAALGVLGALEERLGKPLSLQLFSEHPSIAALAQALLREQAPPEALRALDGGGAEDVAEGQDLPALYLAASGHGDVLRFQALARALRGRMRIFMLQPPQDRAIAGIEELASLYADCVQAQGRPPGWLAGFSVGGVTALETALQLESRGLAPRGLVLLDTIMPEAVLGGTSSWRTVGWLVRKLHIQELSMNGRRLGAMFADPGLVTQVMALRGHRCRRYAGPCLLIKSSGLASWERLLFRPWRRCLDVNRLSERVVSGLHGSIFEPAHVDQLALSLGEALDLPAVGRSA